MIDGGFEMIPVCVVMVGDGFDVIDDGDVWSGVAGDGAAEDEDEDAGDTGATDGLAVVGNISWKNKKTKTKQLTLYALNCFYESEYIQSCQTSKLHFQAQQFYL